MLINERKLLKVSPKKGDKLKKNDRIIIIDGIFLSSVTLIKMVSSNLVKLVSFLVVNLLYNLKCRYVRLERDFLGSSSR